MNMTEHNQVYRYWRKEHRKYCKLQLEKGITPLDWISYLDKVEQDIINEEKEHQKKMEDKFSIEIWNPEENK